MYSGVFIALITVGLQPCSPKRKTDTNNSLVFSLEFYHGISLPEKRCKETKTASKLGSFLKSGVYEDQRDVIWL